MQGVEEPMRRKPLACGVFEDIETARRYHRESAKWMRNAARSFVAVAKEWGIADGKVLDIGTATGSLAIEFAKAIPGVEVVGFDLSAAALELAEVNAQENALSSRVSFRAGNAEDMPFEGDSFDAVISGNTLHLIENPVRMFDEIHRVLKPQGRFIISDFRRSWLGLFTEHFRASYLPEEVGELLNRSKLRNWRLKASFLWLSVLSEE
jgi:ubiquinone/menaquinone biosynthesis C-methylase UbiE